MRSAAARLRALLGGPGVVQAPGAYAALSARVVEAAGFPAVYRTGFGSSAALLGQPDVGLLVQIRAFGYKLVIYPISLLLAATRAMQTVVDAIRQDGTPRGYGDQMLSFAEFNAFIGLPAVRELERLFEELP